MYSPKINEKLIPKLYKIAKAKNMPMTHLVNQILAKAIEKIEVEKRIIREKVVSEVPKEIYLIKQKGVENENK